MVGLKFFEQASRVIAEDMVALFLESEGFADQFPVSSQLFIENVTPESLLEIAGLGKNFGTNIPRGYSLLALLPKRVPDEKKKRLFRDTVSELLGIRKDFSQRKSMEINTLPKMQESEKKSVSNKEYHEILFKLELINERRVPLFRGWGFDAFAWKDSFFRLYNLGTLKKPLVVVMGGKLVNRPSANVFGHVLKPEKVKKAWIQLPEKHIIEHVLEEEVQEYVPETLEERLDLAIRRLSEYLQTRIRKEKTFSVPSIPTTLGNKGLVIKGTERYVSSLLKG